LHPVAPATVCAASELSEVVAGGKDGLIFQHGLPHQRSHGKPKRDAAFEGVRTCLVLLAGSPELHGVLQHRLELVGGLIGIAIWHHKTDKAREIANAVALKRGCRARCQLTEPFRGFALCGQDREIGFRRGIVEGFAVVAGYFDAIRES
jgi:hypothetical protein